MNQTSTIDGVPVFDGASIRPMALATLLTATPPLIPLPCWIDAGETLTKLTEENAQTMAYGIVLAHEMKQAAEDADHE